MLLYHSLVYYTLFFKIQCILTIDIDEMTGELLLFQSLCEYLFSVIHGMYVLIYGQKL